MYAKLIIARFASILLLAFLSEFWPSFAQNSSYRIVGRTGEGIPYANILFKDISDSTLIAVTSTDTLGRYEVPNGISGNILLEVISLGHALHSSVVIMPPPSMLVLEDTAEVLDGAVVSAKAKQIYTSSDNTITTKVEGTPLSRMNRLSDVLLYVPFVSTNGGSYSVTSRGVPEIYVDNRKIRNMEELKLIPAENIDQIDLLLAPGAEYGAAIGAVIRVKTKKKPGDGFSGNFMSSGFYMNGQPSAELVSIVNYRRGNLDIFNTFDLGYTQVSSKTETAMQVSESWALEESSVSTGLLKRPAIYASMGFSNSPARNKVNFGAQYVYYCVPKELIDTDVLGTLKIGDTAPVTFKAIDNTTNPHSQHQMDVYLEVPVTNTMSLHFEGSGEIGENRYHYNIAESTSGSNTKKNIYHSAYSYGFWAGKATASHNIKRLSIDYGLELTHTLYNTEYTVEIPIVDLYRNNSSRSQTNEALFLSLGWQEKGWELSSGLRGERHLIKYETQHNENDFDYFHIFPFISLFRTINDDISASLTYSGGANYPRYYDMRASLEYVSPSVYSTGNNMLNASLNHLTSVNLSLYDFRLVCSYKYVKDAVFTFWEIENNPARVISRPINVPESQRVSIGLFWSRTIKKWVPIVNLNFAKPFLTYGGESYSTPSVSASIQNIFQFNDNLQFYFNASFYSGGHSGCVLYKPNGSLQIGISATFFKKRLNASAYITDPFQLDKESSLVELNNFQMEKVYVSGMNNGIMFTISYSFNQTQARKKSSSAGQDERSRLR